MGKVLLRIVGGASVVTFLVAVFTPAVDLLDAWLTPPRRSEPAEAIVVLGAGSVASTGLLTDTSMPRRARLLSALHLPLHPQRRDAGRAVGGAGVIFGWWRRSTPR